MDTLKEKKLKKLQEKIKEYNTILANKNLLEKETNKDYKNLKIKIIISNIAIASFIALASKFVGLGFPFVRDQVKKYQDIQTTIEQDGSLTEEKNGYIYEKDLDSNYLYNYSNWTSTLSNEHIRYIEKYNLEDINIEEMLAILQEGKMDFDSLEEEPEIISMQTTYTEDELMELSNYKAVFHELDKQDFIYEYEPSKANFFLTAIDGVIFIWASIIFLSLNSSELKKYKNNFSQKVNEKEKEYMIKKEKYVRKLQKIKPNMKNEK